MLPNLTLCIVPSKLVLAFGNEVSLNQVWFLLNTGGLKYVITPSSPQPHLHMLVYRRSLKGAVHVDSDQDFLF
jgi:hypothetical protein